VSVEREVFQRRGRAAFAAREVIAGKDVRTPTLFGRSRDGLRTGLVMAACDRYARAATSSTILNGASSPQRGHLPRQTLPSRAT
jgi:hypothetical protein